MEMGIRNRETQGRKQPKSIGGTFEEGMDSGQRKKEAMKHKLQQLRSVTNSSAVI